LTGWLTALVITCSQCFSDSDTCSMLRVGMMLWGIRHGRILVARRLWVRPYRLSLSICW